MGAGRNEESYTVGQFAELTGTSVSALHHYERCGLIHPRRLANGYRVYGREEVDRMQQVLLYRELEMGLPEIRRILDSPDFDRREALASHLARLRTRRDHLDGIIRSVERSLAEMDGGAPMGAEEKFEAFKQELVDQNEACYGAEARERWGDEAVDASNERLMGLSGEDLKRAGELEAKVRDEVIAGLADGDENDAHARAAVRAHAAWLGLFWPEGTYSPEAHRSLAQMYLADERFLAHYDAWAPGAGRFLASAIERLA